MQNNIDLENFNNNLNYNNNITGFVEYINNILQKICNNTISVKWLNRENITEEEKIEISKINKFSDIKNIDDSPENSNVEIFALYYNNNTIISVIHFLKHGDDIYYMSNTPVKYENKKLNTILRCILILYLYLCFTNKDNKYYLISNAISPISAFILLNNGFRFSNKDIYFIEGYTRINIGEDINNYMRNTCESIENYKNIKFQNNFECIKYLFQDVFYGKLNIKIKCDFINANVAYELLKNTIKNYDSNKCITNEQFTGGNKKTKKTKKKNLKNVKSIKNKNFSKKCN